VGETFESLIWLSGRAAWNFLSSSLLLIPCTCFSAAAVYPLWAFSVPLLSVLDIVSCLCLLLLSFGWRFFIGRLGLAMINLCTKFKVLASSRYEDMNGSAKCRNWGGSGQLGAFRVSRNATIRYSAYDFPFDFNRNYVSIFYRFRDRAGYLSKVDPTFSRFSRTPTCDRQTQTDAGPWLVPRMHSIAR